MKNIFKWIGWILFAFITVILIGEYSGISMYDTCLFSLGGQSVVEYIPDLSPLLMALIYFIILAGNVISAFFKKDHIIINFTNLALSIPIIFVLHRFFWSYPPFGFTECFVLPIFHFITFTYISAIMFILFIGYSIVKLIHSHSK